MRHPIHPVSFPLSPTPALSRALLAWYQGHKRDLPWRGTKDPYAILVSEIMLQQTTVKTVIPYYKPFLKTFPTLRALAKAREEDVLKAWSGLGYYRRARNLHKAVQKVLGEFKGRFPKTLESLRSLPGVGAYTAAAVASIAFGIPEPVLDGNVVRVMTRFLAQGEDPESRKTQETLIAAARDLLSPKQAGDSNQALMELGATVCLPRNPICEECPLAASCKGLREGHPEKYPKPKLRPSSRREAWLAQILYLETKVPRPKVRVVPLRRKAAPPTHEVRLLLIQRQKGEANEGLLEFPMVAKNPINLHSRSLGLIRHSIMSRALHVHVAASPLERKRRHGEELILVQDIPRMPISGLTKKILALWLKSGSQTELF